MSRARIVAAILLFTGAVFLFIGFRSEPRQTVYVILGVVFSIIGLSRLLSGRRR